MILSDFHWYYIKSQYCSYLEIRHPLIPASHERLALGGLANYSIHAPLNTVMSPKLPAIISLPSIACFMRNLLITAMISGGPESRDREQACWLNIWCCGTCMLVCWWVCTRSRWPFMIRLLGACHRIWSLLGGWQSIWFTCSTWKWLGHCVSVKFAVVSIIIPRQYRPCTV